MRMNVEQGVISPSLETAKSKGTTWGKVLLGSTIIALIVSFYMIFIWSPIEKTMGVVQKIFYIHVSSAAAGFIAFFVVAVCSILFLITRKRIYDTYALVSAELGVVFTTIVLTTGPIWARSSWNTWWSWEPRLTTTLILWFIYVAYIMIRQMDGVWEKKARLAAVFGIIGFIDVPIVYFSIRWWTSKFHPIVFGEGPTQQGGGIEDTMLLTLFVTMFALLLLYTLLLQKGVSLENMKIKLNSYKEKLRDQLER